MGMARVVLLLAGLGPWTAVRGLLYLIAMLEKLLKGYRYQFSINLHSLYWQTMDDSHLLDMVLSPLGKRRIMRKAYENANE